MRNIYAYDAAGRLLTDVRLYDDVGRPLDLQLGQDPDRRALFDTLGQVATNAYPLRYFEPGTRVVADPSAGPQVVVPPLVPQPMGRVRRPPRRQPRQLLRRRRRLADPARHTERGAPRRLPGHFTGPSRIPAVVVLEVPRDDPAAGLLERLPLVSSQPHRGAAAVTAAGSLRTAVHTPSSVGGHSVAAARGCRTPR